MVSHIDMINIAVVQMNDGDLALKLYQRGMSLLKKPEGREVLSAAYARICTLLKTEADKHNKPIGSGKLEDVQKRLADNRRKLWR